ncbi:MAG TPA: Asp-tRNA(Asn)/Glu-tRNA(Gln) amidotransferase subunit GatA [Candidatus Paceibacterota bacterium]
MDIRTLTLTEARRLLDAKEFSALELAEAYLKEIHARDSDIHAYLEVWEDSARLEAKAADKKIASGTQNQLTGVPLAIKDNILVEGRVASAASKILENYTASYDATVVTKLKEQGVVFLGRTNMDEFAMGSSTENSACGPTKNPHDTTRVPGGSSGGSAAAVAGNMALAGLGSDTGGSVRQPAALCGVVGLKPTYGAVSRSGLIAMGSSLDQIGPITRTVADARVLFEVISGRDPKDSTSIELPKKQKGKKSLTIGVLRRFSEYAEKDVLKRFDDTLKKLKEAGHKIQDPVVASTLLDDSLAVYYIVMPAEASTNLARFDGIRYGLSATGEDIGDVYKKTRGQGFGKEVRRRILVGTFVLSAGYADAYYRKAIAVRELIRQDFSHAFENGIDVLVTPTAPSPAFKFGEKADPLAMYAADLFTVPVNLAGLPALSVPMGTVSRDSVPLPVGFQIIGPPHSEEVLFAAGEDVERF